LTYDLPGAALWLQQHDLAYRDVAHDARGIEFQPNGEIAILYTLAAVRDDTLAALPQLGAVRALAVGVAGLARRWLKAGRVAAARFERVGRRESALPRLVAPRVLP
jgi:hypothetical protein